MLTRPDPTVAKVLPIVVGTLVSMAVLWWLSPARRPNPCGQRRAGHAVATVGDTDELSPIEADR